MKVIYTEEFKTDVRKVKDKKIQGVNDDYGNYSRHMGKPDEGKSKEEIEAFGVKALEDMLQITNHTLPLPIADRMDCVIVAVAHDEFTQMEFKDLTRMMNENPVLIDIRGMFSGEEAKREGFYYRRL